MDYVGYPTSYATGYSGYEEPPIYVGGGGASSYAIGGEDDWAARIGANVPRGGVAGGSSAGVVVAPRSTAPAYSYAEGPRSIVAPANSPIYVRDDPIYVQEPNYGDAIMDTPITSPLTSHGSRSRSPSPKRKRARSTSPSHRTNRSGWALSKRLSDSKHEHEGPAWKGGQPGSRMTTYATERRTPEYRPTSEMVAEQELKECTFRPSINKRRADAPRIEVWKRIGVEDVKNRQSKKEEQLERKDDLPEDYSFAPQITNYGNRTHGNVDAAVHRLWEDVGERKRKQNDRQIEAMAKDDERQKYRPWNQIDQKCNELYRKAEESKKSQMERQRELDRAARDKSSFDYAHLHKDTHGELKDYPGAGRSIWRNYDKQNKDREKRKEEKLDANYTFKPVISDKAQKMENHRSGTHLYDAAIRKRKKEKEREEAALRRSSSAPHRKPQPAKRGKRPMSRGFHDEEELEDMRADVAERFETIQRMQHEEDTLKRHLMHGPSDAGPERERLERLRRDIEAERRGWQHAREELERRAHATHYDNMPARSIGRYEDYSQPASPSPKSKLGSHLDHHPLYKQGRPHSPPHSPSDSGHYEAYPEPSNHPDPSYSPNKSYLHDDDHYPSPHPAPRVHFQNKSPPRSRWDDDDDEY